MWWQFISRNTNLLSLSLKKVIWHHSDRNIQFYKRTKLIFLVPTLSHARQIHCLILCWLHLNKQIPAPKILLLQCGLMPHLLKIKTQVTFKYTWTQPMQPKTELLYRSSCLYCQPHIFCNQGSVFKPKIMLQHFYDALVWLFYIIREIRNGTVSIYCHRACRVMVHSAWWSTRQTKSKSPFAWIAEFEHIITNQIFIFFSRAQILNKRSRSKRIDLYVRCGQILPTCFLRLTESFRLKRISWNLAWDKERPKVLQWCYHRNTSLYLNYTEGYCYKR